MIKAMKSRIRELEDENSWLRRQIDDLAVRRLRLSEQLPFESRRACFFFG